MRQFWGILLEAIVFSLVLLGSVYLASVLINQLQKDNVYMHEKAHQEIFRMFGCNSTIEISNNGMYGLTKPQNCSFISDEVMKIQAENEIFTYNSIGIFSVLCWMLFTMIIFMAMVIALLIRNQRIVVLS